MDVDIKCAIQKLLEEQNKPKPYPWSLHLYFDDKISLTVDNITDTVGFHWDAGDIYDKNHPAHIPHGSWTDGDQVKWNKFEEFIEKQIEQMNIFMQALGFTIIELNDGSGDGLYYGSNTYKKV